METTRIQEVEKSRSREVRRSAGPSSHAPRDDKRFDFYSDFWLLAPDSYCSLFPVPCSLFPTHRPEGTLGLAAAEGEREQAVQGKANPEVNQEAPVELRRAVARFGWQQRKQEDEVQEVASQDGHHGFPMLAQHGGFIVAGNRRNDTAVSFRGVGSGE